jgi:guanine deaminase
MSKKLMQQAISVALENIDLGGGPFGAVIIKDGEIIASSGNQVTQLNDPTAHAEILAIREAAKKLNTWDLSGCTLFTSCEPCPMCLSAIYWAHITKVYYACNHNDAKNAGFDDSFIYDELKLNPEKRTLSMVELLREDGLETFKKWKRFPDKKKY